MDSSTNVIGLNTNPAKSEDCVAKAFTSEKEFLIFYTQWLQKQDAEAFNEEWVLNHQQWYTNEQLVQKYLAEMNNGEN